MVEVKKISEILHFLRLVLRSLVALILLLIFSQLALARIYRDHLAAQGWALAAQHGPSIVMSWDISLDDGTAKTSKQPRYLCLYDPSTRTASALVQKELPWWGAPVLRSDRQTFLYADEAGLWEPQLATGEAQLLIPAGTENYYHYGFQYVPGTEDISFHPYSQDSIYKRIPELLYVFHRDTGEIEAVCSISDGYSYAWLDSQRLVLPDDRGLAIYDLGTGRSTHWLTLDLIQQPGFRLAANQSAFVLSEDGSHLAWVGADLVLYILTITPETVDDSDRMEAGWYGQEETYPGKGHDLRFCFSPDGEALLYCVQRWKNALFNPVYDTLYLWAEGNTYTLYKAYPNWRLWFDW